MTEPYDSNYHSYTQAVTAARNGVQAAFRYLYESTYRDKYYIAQKYMRNEAEAQDVLQDAYMKAWTNLSQLQEPEKFPGWLSMIVASTALNTLKKKKDLPFSALEQTTEDGDTFFFEEEDWRREYQPEHAFTDKETSELLNEMMDALSDEQRFCVLMYYVEEHSVAEIASLIGCPENTVKSRLNYGRKNLKKKAEEMEKKGYKLYGISIVPLLLWLFRSEANAASVVIPALNTAGAVAASKTGLAGTGQITVSSTGTGSVTSAAVTTATAGKAAGLSLGAKIAVAALATSLIGAGGLVWSIRATSSIIEKVSGADSSDLTAMVQSVSEGAEEAVTTIEEIVEDETEVTETTNTAAELTWDSFDGLYSGFHQGQYYYVWVEMHEGARYPEPDGTVRLLWKGDRPYQEGDALLPDDPRNFYNVVSYGYEIRPGWDGADHSNITIGDGAYQNNFTLPIRCFDFWMERDTEFLYDGTTLKKR